MIIFSDCLLAALNEALWSADYHGDQSTAQAQVWLEFREALKRNEYCAIVFRAPVQAPKDMEDLK